MNRYFRIIIATFALMLCFSVQAQQVAMPGENGRKEAVNYDYFPHRQYAFVWRNWAVVPKEKIAQVLSTSVENVEALATWEGSMKLDINCRWNDFVKDCTRSGEESICLVVTCS